MTVDIISELGFGHSFGLMQDVKGTDFRADFLHAFDLVATSLWDMLFFPVIRSAMGILPTAITTRLGGPAAHFERLMEVYPSPI